MSVTVCTTVPTSFPPNCHIRVVNPSQADIRVAVPSASTQSAGLPTALAASTDFNTYGNDTWNITTISSIPSQGQAIMIEQMYGLDSYCVACPSSSSSNILNIVRQSTTASCCTWNMYCSQTGGYQMYGSDGSQVAANTTVISQGSLAQSQEYSLIVTNDTTIKKVGGTFNISPD